MENREYRRIRGLLALSVVIVVLTLGLFFFLRLTDAGGPVALQTGTTASSPVELPVGEVEDAVVTLDTLPDYAGDAFVVLAGNIPDFSEAHTRESYELYAQLDFLGRCGVAEACVGQELMPTEGRESISAVTPSGWVNVTYDFVDGGYLYNRCHLIGFQLTGENANERNLITGTRYLNIEGMLPFENLIADYVRETGNHVLYRVTPVFRGAELVARGVQLEGWSVEDEGEGVCFNVYAYNVQPGVVIDYASGRSEAEKAA